MVSNVVCRRHGYHVRLDRDVDRLDREGRRREDRLVGRHQIRLVFLLHVADHGCYLAGF
jgi:hypothetical protein